ncbi:MAG: hypothetical protein ACI9VR_000413 [Cognaticolwellia sp.]|jgi:hypothetical protein
MSEFRTTWLAALKDITRPQKLSRVGFTLAFAGLAGIVAAHGPQPLTDTVSGWLPESAPTQVVVVSMDGAGGIVAWQEAAERARAIGVPVVAAVQPPAGQINAQVFDPQLGAHDDVGLSVDWDGKSRTWTAASGNRATLPARIRDAAGQPVQGTLRLSSQEPASMHHSHLAYLAPGALGDSVVILGQTDPWVTPMVRTFQGRIPLAEAVARAVASPDALPSSALWVGLLSGLAGLFGALSVLSMKKRQMVIAAVVAPFLGSIGALALGTLLPVEAMLVGSFSGAAVAGLLRWSRHHVGFVSLVDRAIWHLNVQPARSRVEEAWLELAVAAVELGVAHEAYILEGEGSSAVLQAAAGQRGVLLLNELPPPFANPLVVALPDYAGRSARLLMRRSFAAESELRALRTLAAHQARHVANQPARFIHEQGYLAQGVGIIGSAFDVLLRRGDRLGGALQAGVGARAVFDPLGRLMTSDQRLEPVLFREGRPLEPRLVGVWSAVGGNANDVSVVLTGGPMRRITMDDGSLLALSAVVDGHKLSGMMIEYIPAQDAPAERRTGTRASLRR